MLEHDPGRLLGVALGEHFQRLADVQHVDLRRRGDLLDGQRLRRDDEQGLDGLRQLGSGRDLGGDQAEWAVQDKLLSASAREILIGANGAGCAIAISFCLRSSSKARKATATSTRESPATSWSKSKRE